jgi:hypothetical protein
VTTAGLDRRLEHIETVVEQRGPDLAQLLREALEAHGITAVVAVCERLGVTLETAQRWADEPGRHVARTVRRLSP